MNEKPQKFTTVHGKANRSCSLCDEELHGEFTGEKTLWRITERYTELENDISYRDGKAEAG